MHVSEDEHLQRYRTGNLFGNPDDVIAQLRVFEQSGVSHMGIVSLGDTIDELMADIDLFAREVMPVFT